MENIYSNGPSRLKIEISVMKINNHINNDETEFLHLCRENVERKEQGEITIRTASTNICKLCVKYFDAISPKYAEIMDVACDLELPDGHRDRPLDDWEKLKRLLQKSK